MFSCEYCEIFKTFILRNILKWYEFKAFTIDTLDKKLLLMDLCTWANELWKFYKAATDFWLTLAKLKSYVANRYRLPVWRTGSKF